MLSEGDSIPLGTKGNGRREPRCRARAGLLHACVGQGAGLGCYALYEDAHRTNRRALSKPENACFGMPRRGRKEASGGDLVFGTFTLTHSPGDIHVLRSNQTVYFRSVHSTHVYYHKTRYQGWGRSLVVEHLLDLQEAKGSIFSTKQTISPTTNGTI